MTPHTSDSFLSRSQPNLTFCGSKRTEISSIIKIYDSHFIRIKHRREIYEAHWITVKVSRQADHDRNELNDVTKELYIVASCRKIQRLGIEVDVRPCAILIVSVLIT